MSKLSRRRTAVTAAVCGALIVLSTGLAAGANAATKPVVRTWKSGVFAGYGPQPDAAFQTWRGSDLQTTTDFLPQDNWAGLENPAWDIWAWGLAPSVTPTLTAAMWPASGGSFAEAASGADNTHWATLAKNLVAGGLGSATIRLGWEFNGTWYRWSVTNPTQAAQYVAAWRQIITAMRSVPGANFTFDWCPTIGATGLNPALSYPGDSYVDYIGEDAYDWNGGVTRSAANRWNYNVTMAYGLNWQASFAASHNKPMSYPEWGVTSNTKNVTNSSGDDPLFVQNMFNWFSSHNVAYENYFDSDPGNGLSYGLTTGNRLFPNSAALYQSLYSHATYSTAGTTVAQLR